MNLIRLRDTIIILLLSIFALIYSLPNIYPEYPAVELKLANTNIEDIKELLLTHNIIPSNEEISELSWISFDSTDKQMQAKALIEKKYPDTAPSLNLKRDMPSWLTKIGAKPMKLGLDLRGGVHLLLAVDTSFIENKMLEQQLSAFKLSIPDITQAEVVKNSKNSIKVKFDNTKKDIVLNKISKMHLEVTSNSNDEAVLVLPIPEAALSDVINIAIDQTLRSLDKRINELGIAEATVARQGQKFISIDLPGIQDISRAKSLLGKTATLRFHILADNLTAVNAEIINLPMRNSGMMAVEKTAVLNGDAIIFARAQRDDHGVSVHIGLDQIYEHSFNKLTGQNIGRRMAVVYVESQNDNLEEIISAPMIQSALGSQFQISGLRNYREAQDLAMLLRSGALAAPVSVVEEAIIGPSLGEDNIQKGINSLLASAMLVFTFMGCYYRAYGVAANIGLTINILLIVAVLSILDATLTLPGIAGIVLTVGMAVDANVLINERIREELRAGENLQKSISMGYKRAFDTIFDSNMSTLLIAIILFGLGSGSIKGFAITLTIGILASLITSVYLTRYIVTYYAANRKNMQIGFDFFNHHSNIKFMKLKNKAIILSIILVCLSCLTIAVKGIKLGLDFTGGVEMRLQSAKVLYPEELREQLKSIGMNTAVVQSVGGMNEFLVRVPSMDISTKTMNDKIIEAIPEIKITQMHIIGPQVGAELLRTAWISVLLALLGCTSYIAVRFEWRFALAALISLMHDPILILGMLALSGLEFNLITLAAVITVMGYSLNDTIVIYDRVRETFQKRINISSEESIDLSTNQTLSRTLLTSGLTLLVVLCLALLGGESLRGFSWSLITGIIVGTYSSIYVAGTLSVQLGLKRDHLVKKRVKKIEIIV